MLKEKKILSKYDEEIEGVKKESMMLGTYVGTVGISKPSVCVCTAVVICDIVLLLSFVLVCVLPLFVFYLLVCCCSVILVYQMSGSCCV
jgi:hypothetical protein